MPLSCLKLRKANTVFNYYQQVSGKNESLLVLGKYTSTIVGHQNLYLDSLVQ